MFESSIFLRTEIPQIPEKLSSARQLYTPLFPPVMRKNPRGFFRRTTRDHCHLCMQCPLFHSFIFFREYKFWEHNFSVWKLVIDCYFQLLNASFSLKISTVSYGTLIKAYNLQINHSSTFFSYKLTLSHNLSKKTCSGIFPHCKKLRMMKNHDR